MTIELLLTWDQQHIPLAEQAKQLGIRYGALAQRRRRLMRVGRIRPWQPGGGRDWTTKEIDTLIRLIETGHGYTTLARRLKRTRMAVQVKCKRLGIRPLTTKNTLSARDIADLLGLSCSKTVGRWITRLKWLPATNAGEPQRPLWRVQWDDFLAFLERSDYWMAWGPEKITDPCLREWALEMRANGPVWIRAGEVAKRVGVGRTVPQSWIEKGILTGVKYGNWWFKEEDLEGFVIPIERPRIVPLYSDGLPARVLGLLTSEPQSAKEIADQLSITTKAACQALRRLQTKGEAQRLESPVRWIKK